MPTPPMTDAALIQALQALASAGGNVSHAAMALGIPRGTLQNRLRAAELRGLTGAAHEARHERFTPRLPAEELDIPAAPDPNEPIAELVARKKAQYQREQASDAFHKLVPNRVRKSGPVAICAIGDPHVDDDKCDIGAIERDMTIIGQTHGMFALHVGDITNNWVGRLGRLYANQTTKASDGIRLAEWMFEMAPPLAVVAGNHDLWNDGMSWLQFCVRQAGNATLQPHGVRIELQFPGKQPVRIHCRHDFPGHSQYNPVHGLRKEHLFGFRDHINIAGHKHIDAYSVIPSPDGYMQHMLRVSGYKGHDDYAKQGNFQPMKMAPACAMVIDPAAKNPAELMKPFWDMEEAADFLSFKRRRVS